MAQAARISDPPIAQERRLKMSYEEYLAWDDGGKQTEWADGEVIIFMPPTTVHQRVAYFFARLLSAWVEHVDLGEVFMSPLEMLILDSRASREPDVLFVAREHLDRVTTKGLEGPADLVVELI